MIDDFDSLYRLVYFPAVLVLVVLERVRVLQRQPVRIARRWTSNVGLFLIANVVASIAVPIGIFAFARQQPPGLLAQLPLAAQLIVTFVFLDFWRYWEHRCFHRFRPLWRFHLVHHSDIQIDVTTAERHHPLEALIGTGTLVALVLALRLPASGLALYLLTATVVALWSHANLRLPSAIEQAANGLIVTPAVHAVHHSALQKETDSNYGSVLTVWDRLFGTYVDPPRARIPHYGLDYFHQPRDTGLTGVLRQPFLFRRDLVYPDRDSAAAPERAVSAGRSIAAMPKDCRDALIAGITGAVLVSLAMWPTLKAMIVSWRDSEAYQYAWLVLPMVVYMLGWHHRHNGVPLKPRPDFTGVLVVAIAALCWAVAALMNVDVGRQFAFVLALQGVAMSTLGWRSYWRLFPTFALMFLMIPCGDLALSPLRVLTVQGIDLFALAANLPHSVEGFVIFIGKNRYIVVDECSGLAYVTLATFLGYCFGLLLYRSLWKVLALSLCGAFLGILSNMVRVNAIVAIDWLRGSQMDLAAHGTIQWIALFAVLGLLFYIVSRLTIDTAPAPPMGPATERLGPARKLAPVLAGVSLLLVAGTTAGFPTDSAEPHISAATVVAPALSGWKPPDAPAAWSLSESDGIESLRLIYERNAQQIQAVIVETVWPGVKLAESALAPHDGTVWRESRVERETACAAAICMTLVHRTWQQDKSHQLRHVYYAYSIGDRVTDSKLALRAAHGWERLRGGSAKPRLIGFISDNVPLDLDELAAAFPAIRVAVDSHTLR